MLRFFLRLSLLLIFAFVFSAGSFLFEGAFAFSADTIDLSEWSESATREAGTRQTLTIGDEEYGFVWIPAGEFDMGSPESEERRFKIEKLHHVKLTKGFWMLETETTQALYEEIVGENPSDFEGDDLPVETVSWDDAIEFCAELTKRLPAGLKATLPTEAQWEYACRAGSTTPFSFGSVLNGDKANCDGRYPYGTSAKGKYVGKTTPVKSYDPNPWGLYDMHGNVWEWTSDCYVKYPTGSAIDPKNPNSASDRVTRGGSWNLFARSCRSANRSVASADDWGDDLGFRFLLICDETSDQSDESTDEIQFDDSSDEDQTDESTTSGRLVATDASSWSESATREAGTRRTLTIGDAEYGFVWIPAGEFEMGSPTTEKDRDNDETLHHVKLTKGFWMLETETTQALYEEIVGKNPSYFRGDNLPVEEVSWRDARKFCTELTKRLPAGLTATLPTEAQWEYACRAGTKTAYWHGDSPDAEEMCFGQSTPTGTTKETKSYPANPWGLYDMHGNVWEWTLDYYAEYPTGSAIDPKGPNSAADRATRGGSWGNDARLCRSACRGRLSASKRFYSLGFRFLLSCE